MGGILKLSKKGDYQFTCHFNSEEEMIKAMKALEKNNISVRVKNIIYSSFQKGDKNESTVL